MYDYLIAVATLNGPARLEEFITSVIRNTEGINYAISICDDCSDQHLSEQNYALAVKYKCFYTRNPNRSGVPYSWNRACELADSKFIVMCNDDIVVVPGWLHAHHLFRKANEHLNIGVIGWPATNQREIISTARKFTVNADASHLDFPPVAVAGYLFAFPRSLYQEVGGFDQRYFANWEEIDFGASCAMKGLHSVGMNGPLLYHQGGATFSDPLNQRPELARAGASMNLWFDKWSKILGIKKGRKTDTNYIAELSLAITSKHPRYKLSDFNEVVVDLDNPTIEFKPVVPHDDIEGWFDFMEIYDKAVTRAQDGAVFVEIGSWMGKSACYLAELIRKSGKKISFTCVDIWDDNWTDAAFWAQICKAREAGKTLMQMFRDNLDRYGVGEYVKSIKSDSSEGAKFFEDGTVDMVFIDASHEYEYVKRDLEAWWPKVKPGGIFAGHDFFYAPGVRQAVEEFFRSKGREFRTINQSWYVEK